MTNQTAPLRDRIADAIAGVDAGSWGTETRAMHPYWRKVYQSYADAVLAVLPATTNHDTDTSNPRADRAAAARVRSLHQQYRFAGDDTTDYCAHCNQISGGWIPWPCPTVQALDAELRRVADETATTETQAPQRPDSLATPCSACDHARNWHDTTRGICLVSTAPGNRCDCPGFTAGEQQTEADEPAAGAQR